MAKFTIVSGYLMAEACEPVEARSPLEAAILAHRQMLRDAKRALDGFSYEEHSGDWGKAGAQTRRDGSGNGAQSLDDCLLICPGDYSDTHEFSRADAVSIVRCIEDAQ